MLRAEPAVLAIAVTCPNYDELHRFAIPTKVSTEAIILKLSGATLGPYKNKASCTLVNSTGLTSAALRPTSSRFARACANRWTCACWWPATAGTARTA